MLKRCRGNTPLAGGLGDSGSRLVVGAKLSDDSFSLQVDEIFSRRDRGQPSHPFFGFSEAFDRGYPECVSVLQSFEYVEPIIHRSLLMVAVRPSESRSRTSTSVREADSLLQSGQSVGRCRAAETVFRSQSRLGIFFCTMGKMFHLRYWTFGYPNIRRGLTISRQLYERCRTMKFSGTTSVLSLRVSVPHCHKVSSPSL